MLYLCLLHLHARLPAPSLPFSTRVSVSVPPIKLPSLPSPQDGLNRASIIAYVHRPQSGIYLQKIKALVGKFLPPNFQLASALVLRGLMATFSFCYSSRRCRSCSDFLPAKNPPTFHRKSLQLNNDQSILRKAMVRVKVYLSICTFIEQALDLSSDWIEANRPPGSWVRSKILRSTSVSPLSKVGFRTCFHTSSYYDHCHYCWHPAASRQIRCIRQGVLSRLVELENVSCREFYDSAACYFRVLVPSKAPSSARLGLTEH